MGVLCTILVKNGLIKPVFRGVSVILYDGFRKCFVNCKFTFYITLSSYLKKVKIPKTRKTAVKCKVLAVQSRENQVFDSQKAKQVG